jgi:hypothetical protein
MEQGDGLRFVSGFKRFNDVDKKERDGEFFLDNF